MSVYKKTLISGRIDKSIENIDKILDNKFHLGMKCQQLLYDSENFCISTSYLPGADRPPIKQRGGPGRGLCIALRGG